jgi:hypothetical protein
VGEERQAPDVIYLLIAVAALALAAAALWWRRTPVGDDVARFNRARSLTTEWSRRYAATGHLDLPHPQTEERVDQPEHASANH